MNESKTASQMHVAPQIVVQFCLLLSIAPYVVIELQVCFTSHIIPSCHPHITPATPSHSIIFDILEVPAF